MADLANNPLLAGGGMGGLNINSPELQQKLMEYMMQMNAMEPQQQNIGYQRQQAAALRQNPSRPASSWAGVLNQGLEGGMQGYLDKQALKGNQDLARQKFEAWKRMQGTPGAPQVVPGDPNAVNPLDSRIPEY